MSDPRRFLLVTPMVRLSGAFLALTEVAGALVRAGHGVDVSITDPTSAEPAAREALAQSGAAELGSTVVPDRYAAALVNGLAAHRELAALAGRLPTAWWIHESLSGLNLLRENAGAAEVLELAHHLIFPHAHCRDTIFAPFLTGIPEHRISIVPSGVAWPKQWPSEAEDEARHGVLFAGALEPRKRPVDLMKAALASLPEDVPIRFAGETDRLPAEDRALAEGAPDRIRLLGPLPPYAMQAEYRRAAVFCLPSDNESFGRAPLEAALNGCAVVVSELPVYRGLWMDGQTALTHRVGDVARLGIALRLLHENPAYRRGLAAAGRRAAMHYPAEETVLRIRLILERLPAIFG
jgi:glycosyltransferase involved in cell wall biosynthesis